MNVSFITPQCNQASENLHWYRWLDMHRERERERGRKKGSDYKRTFFWCWIDCSRFLKTLRPAHVTVVPLTRNSLKQTAPKSKTLAMRRSWATDRSVHPVYIPGSLSIICSSVQLAPRVSVFASDCLILASQPTKQLIHFFICLIDYYVSFQVWPQNSPLRQASITIQ